MKEPHTQHVFIIGCKGIPAHYGGFETFVDKLTGYHKNPAIQYHVACAVEPEDYDRSRAKFTYHRAKCVTFPWRKIGPARAIAYDVDALRYFLHYVEKHQVIRPVFYILACRIGPFIGYFARRIKACGGELYVNPDGHEFLRAKWSPAVCRYWKYSERLMVKHAGMLICDSRTIEQYIQEEYSAYHPKTTFIAYGAETVPSRLLDDDARLLAWYDAHGLRAGEYYLVVGRFVPENNYEVMIREYMQSDTDKKFALITDVSDDFLQQLRRRTGFEDDPRICFAGTVYDQQLLKKIRENAYGYFHGHEVGGTNPSLLEALACTKLNLLLDVGFNREVAMDGAYYWTKDPGSLSALIRFADRMEQDQISRMGEKAHRRIADCYSWEFIVRQYERLFLLSGNMERP